MNCDCGDHERHLRDEVMIHTPGPWVAKGDAEGEWHVEMGSHDGGVYTEVGVADGNDFGDGGPYLSEADARLIAAAPDGLEFARAVTEWMANLGPDNMSSLTGRLYEQGLAFIAKAEGLNV